MTRIEVLQSAIEVNQKQLAEVRDQRYQAQQCFHSKLTTTFTKFFMGVVDEDVAVNGTTNSIVFSMLNEEGHLKEIFQIYLRHSWRSEGMVYHDIQLSYYTTSTSSDFELQRLVNLGRVASVVKGMKQEILDKVNTLADQYNEEVTKLGYYKKIDAFESKISQLRSQIKQIQIEEVKVKLFTEEGLSFEKPIQVQMKYNYTPTIKHLKLVDVSKSGKKAKAVFTLAYGDHTSYEENVNVASILEQVL